MSNEMEKEFIALLSSIIEKDADAPLWWVAPEIALKGLKCINPELGKWIDACDFPFLIETLMLDDAIFFEEFPGVRLSAEERKGFARALDSHCETCDRCRMKRAGDIELQLSVNRAFAENKKALGKVIARAAGTNDRD